MIFSVPKAIPPGLEDNMLISGFIKVDRLKAAPQSLGEPSLEIVYGTDGRERGVRLSNSRLIVWFNLIPAPEDNERNWFTRITHISEISCICTDTI